VKPSTSTVPSSKLTASPPSAVTQQQHGLLEHASVTIRAPEAVSHSRTELVLPLRAAA